MVASNRLARSSRPSPEEAGWRLEAPHIYIVTSRDRIDSGAVSPSRIAPKRWPAPVTVVATSIFAQTVPITVAAFVARPLIVSSLLPCFHFRLLVPPSAPGGWRGGDLVTRSYSGHVKLQAMRNS